MHRRQVVELRREFEVQVAQLSAELELAARERAPAWPSEPSLMADHPGQPPTRGSGTTMLAELEPEGERSETDGKAPLSAPTLSSEVRIGQPETAHGAPVRPAESDRAAHRSEAGPMPRHLVFFPAPAYGYMLVERTGSVPRPGDVIDVSEHGGSATAVVTKAARSPFPGSEFDCAYLM
jgi:hypothetical protein